jgi:hypothetical protein
MLPLGRDRGDYDQIVLGQDVSFAWRHLQIWAEFYESRFEVPTIFGGAEFNADAFSYHVEAKYKLFPQLSVALRWNQQFFNDAPDALGGPDIPWWHDISRIEVAAIYRPTEHTQVKLQYYVDHEEDAAHDFRHRFAAQFTVRF